MGARGIRRLAAPVLAFQILKPISVEKDGARASLLPSDHFEIEFHIDFADAAIGRQSLSLDMRNGTFARELCDSRTFCRQSDVDSMHANGLALGDLSLAGGPLMGHYIGERAGHALTNTLLRELFCTPGAVRTVLCSPEQSAILPGQGLVLSEIPNVA